MYKKLSSIKKSHMAKELILLSIRLRELKYTKMNLVNTNNNIKKTLNHKNHYKSFSNTIISLEQTILEIDMEIHKRKKRIKRIITKFIKDSDKLFEESPSTIIPGTRDILNGYIELNEIDNNDQLIKNVLLLNIGEIHRLSDYASQAILHEYYVDKDILSNIASYLILKEKVDTKMSNIKDVVFKKNEDNELTAILTKNNEIKLKDNSFI